MAIIRGTLGNDKLVGTRFADTIYGLAGSDLLLGLAGNDTLYGGRGNDTLNGGAGIDSLIGGVGNDEYIVDNVSDKVVEAANAGRDTVSSTVGYTLPNNVENLILTGKRNINGTGNALANEIIGNDGNNILAGGAGNDLLYGDAGNNTLYGGTGNDTLSGGAGNNLRYGGNGNDTYILEQLGDRIIEFANEGVDTVIVYHTYTLGDNLENLTLANTLVDMNGTGNSLNNVIVGNSSNNILRGKAGNDSLHSGEGGDILIGTERGIAEKDTLTGGSGRDVFVLGNATTAFYDDGNPTTPGFGDYALITDFNPNEDFIRLNGKRSDYILAASPIGLPTGTAIFRQQQGATNELIAIVQSLQALNLNGDYFLTDSNNLFLFELDGKNGFVLQGINSGDSAGASVSNAGDINGDGLDDIIIGAPSANPNGRVSAGESYIVFGKATRSDNSINLANLNGKNGFVLQGINRYSYSGRSVSNAGDINGDGFDDIIIGAPSVGELYTGEASRAGESYIVFGTSRFDARVDLANLDANNGFVIQGRGSFSKFGSSVNNAGDINGDGFDDLIIGAPGSSPKGVYPPPGKSYIVFGKASGFNARVDIANLYGYSSFVLQGIKDSDYSGRSVSNAGDINGDGLDDLIISAPGAGESYIVFGKTARASFDLASLDGNNGFVLQGGSSVNNAGDINGDGLDDLIIGAPSASPNGRSHAGESYVVFGTSGFDARVDLASLDGNNGFVLQGSNAYNSVGSSVSNAGDVNGDGFDDILIGAAGARGSYLVFGKASGFDARVDLATLDSSNGFVFRANTDGYSSFSVSSGGDINGDGYDDMILGAPSASPDGRFIAGESYVIYGRDFTGSVTRQGTAGNDLLIGTNADDILIGGLGNDTLRGGGGRNVLIGGAGDDVLTFSAQNRCIDGGSGTDTLAINASGLTLDLTLIPNNRISGIEIIDLTGTGNNALQLTRLKLLNLSDSTNQLIVKGNAGDSIISTGQGWLLDTTATLDGNLYNRYLSGAATLLVDTDITRTLS
ncbi:FG-GAP repeat protein [Gloeocapsopsis sp. IPPAS B-1203]|uniref:FG-GAP repeat protein n=1 Tax=Gloeocapsopsis sp. IPPAS B-1203 TaxID=2049454 RepID=UPI000C19280E|nr:FG-GAP repeat protein [Gloeocapsopsis sp. IPPAS B-1203]PIG94250.1 hypothetical protein CSQ79_07985 [Gloeocapsopsis sp. IPPAS B-1203]